MTRTVQGYYGMGHNPCNVFCYDDPNGTWYAVEGSQNVNFTFDLVEDDVCVETLNDHDVFTWTDAINSEEELEEAVED